MRRPGLRDLLERLVIDREFLAAFQSDPAGAIQPFDLTERQRSLLCDGGEDARALLAEAFAMAPAAKPAAEPAPAPAGAASPSTPLAPGGSPGGAIRLLARLMFSVAAADTGQAQLHYAATLHVLPADADAATVPPPDLDPRTLPGDRLNDALFELKVAPHLTRDDAGAFQVDCLQATVPVATRPGRAGQAAAAQPVRHDTDAAIPPLVAAVRKAPPGRRQEALRALVAAIDTDAQHG